MTRDEICEEFIESVTYDLYPVQEEALLAWFDTDAGVLVCAPTGMGKTLIAEAAIFEALHTRKPIYYTTPLIALTEQKFREFGKLVESWGFSRDDVGFITGNRRKNPDALVRVVVAEILLNHLLGHDTGLSSFDQVGSVVMDEFHNFNDRERGAVWEEEWRAALLRQAIRELRDGSKIDPRTIRAFECFAYENRPAAQVATELGMTVDEVYVAKSRVLQRLRRIIDELNETW